MAPCVCLCVVWGPRRGQISEGNILIFPFNFIKVPCKAHPLEALNLFVSQPGSCQPARNALSLLLLLFFLNDKVLGGRSQGDLIKLAPRPPGDPRACFVCKANLDTASLIFTFSI